MTENAVAVRPFATVYPLVLVLILAVPPLLCALNFEVFVHHQRGKFYFETGRYDQARESLEQAMRVEPEHLDSRVLLGRTYVAIARKSTDSHTRLAFFLKARDLETGVTGLPSEEELSEAYIGSADAASDLETKQELLQNALEIAPGRRVYRILKRMKALADLTGKYRPLLDYTYLWYQRRRTETLRQLAVETHCAAAEHPVSVPEKISLLTTALKLRPADDSIRQKVALAYVDLAGVAGLARRRIAILEEALTFDHTCAPARTQLAAACVEEAEFVGGADFARGIDAVSSLLEKEAWYRRALDAVPGYEPAVRGMAAVNLERVPGIEDDTARLDLLQEVIEIIPVIRAYYVMAGESYGRDDHLNRIEALRLAMRENPDNEEIRKELADECFHLALWSHSPAEKMKWYDMALSYFQEHIPALHNYGVLLQKKELIDEAIIKYRAAITGDSRYAPSFFNLGLLYWIKKDDLPLAIKSFRHYRLLDPASASSHKVAVWIERLEKEWEQRELAVERRETEARRRELEEQHDELKRRQEQLK